VINVRITVMAAINFSFIEEKNLCKTWATEHFEKCVRCTVQCLLNKQIIRIRLESCGWISSQHSWLSVFFCLARRVIFPNYSTQNYISDTSLGSHTENFHTAIIRPFQVLYLPAESAGLLCLINGCLSTLRIIKCSEVKKT